MVPRCGYILLLTLVAAVPLAGREKSKLSYGEGLIVSVPLPVGEVEQVVGDVAQNGVIRGTKEYNKDEFVGGAKAATSSQVFPPWTEGGKVFYKVREQALDPRNFHRKVTGAEHFLVETGAVTSSGGGRPAQLYRRGGAVLLHPPMLRPR